jgi:hypothetical protein
MANVVTLTFAGDPTKAVQSFDEVGGAAGRMSKATDEASDGFSKAGEAADNVDTKAMGFRDTLTGVQDSLKGTAMLAKGPSFEGFLTLGAGIGDLGSGFYNFLIPALEKTKLATLASTAASKVAAAGTKAWAAAQRILSLSLLASPVTWIILGIVALIAVIVLIATKTDWFQRAWRNTWKWVTNAASASWAYLKKIPGWLGTAFSKVANYLLAPFRAAFNGISRAWNNTVGQLSWSVPGWVPVIGGNSISVPNLPTWHTGGTVPGLKGTSVMAMIQAGEKVTSTAGAMTGDGGGWVAVRGDAVVDALTQAIAARVNARGGRAAQLGIRFA